MEHYNGPLFTLANRPKTDERMVKRKQFIRARLKH